MARARLEAVHQIVDLARKERADFVLVARDAFKSHQVSRSMLYEVLQILRASPCPVFLLPGNHNPLVPESIYHLREEWHHLPGHVLVSVCSPWVCEVRETARREVAYRSLTDT